jgi:muconolactone D-isomerase
MKFLLIAKSKETPPMPPEQVAEAIVAEWQIVHQLLNEGKIEVAYSLAGQKGGMVIFEVESGAELNKIISSLPLYPFLDAQIYPLMTADEALTQAKEGLEAIKTKQ